MGNKGNMRQRKYGGNMLLPIILIGFCILAIIEIFYGQAKIRTERERPEPEEENYQFAQDETSEEPTEGENSEESAGDEEEYAMQIVVLGDSIMADGRDENKDVPTLIGEACDAKVYNLAIGGTTAALLPDEQDNYEDWSSTGLLGVVNAMVGKISSDVFDGYETENLLKQCDFSKTDYFVIEYGINDFTSRQIPQSIHLENGEVLEIDEDHTYAGALDDAVNTLVRYFPNASILIVSPHYCHIFEDATYMGDAYSVNYGYGTLVDFFRVAAYVANQHKEQNVIFFNAMEQGGIDQYTSDEYLEDGIHLTNAGRRMYADKIAAKITADFYREE